MDRLKTLNLLFLEDNKEFAANTVQFLALYFKEIFHSPTIKHALELFKDNKIDVVISDIKVEDGNGLLFIQTLREFDKEIPIIVLSAHKDEDFLFKAISLNLSSYELKPLSYDRFQKIFTMLRDKLHSKDKFVFQNGVEYSFEKKELYVNSQGVKLAKMEVLFIELMIKNCDKIVTLEMIQRSVWQEKLMSDSALKNLIFRLRKKIDAEFILTVQCLGYKIAV